MPLTSAEVGVFGRTAGRRKSAFRPSSFERPPPGAPRARQALAHRASQQLHPQSQPSQPHPSSPQQSLQQSQQLQQSPHPLQSQLVHDPSLRSPLHGRGTCRSTTGTCRPAPPTPRSPRAVRAGCRAAAPGAAAHRGLGAPEFREGRTGGRRARRRRCRRPGRRSCPSSCTSSRCTSRPSANSASRSASRTPCTASSASRRASVSGVPVAVSGFQAPDAASASLSSTASRRWASRPKRRPASASGSALSGRPARYAVCANAAAVAVSVGSVTASRAYPDRRAPRCRPAGPRRPPARRCRSRRHRRRGRRPRPNRWRSGGRRGPPAVAPACRPRRRRGRGPWRRPAPGTRPPRAGRPHRGRRRRCASRATGRAGRTPPGTRSALTGLSLRQNRYEQAVIVSHDPRELTVVPAQRETQPAQMRHPLAREALPEPVPARPDDSDTTFPVVGPVVGTTLSCGIVSTAAFTRTYPSSPVCREESYFTHSQHPFGKRPLGHKDSRRIRCAPVPSQTPRAASIHLARRPHHG